MTTYEETKKKALEVYRKPESYVHLYFKEKDLDKMKKSTLEGIITVENTITNRDLIKNAYLLLQEILKNSNKFGNEEEEANDNVLDVRYQRAVGIPKSMLTSNITEIDDRYRQLIKSIQKGDNFTFKIYETPTTSTLKGFSALANYFLEKNIYSILIIPFADILTALSNYENCNDYLYNLKHVKYLFIDNYDEKLLREYKRFLFQDVIRYRELSEKITVLGYAI